MELREAIKEFIREVLRKELEVTKKGVTKEEPKGLADWDNAPDWAMYHAIDEDGESFWYKEEPQTGDDMWIPRGVFNKHYRFNKYFYEDEVGDWANSLQKRP